MERYHLTQQAFSVADLLTSWLPRKCRQRILTVHYLPEHHVCVRFCNGVLVHLKHVCGSRWKLHLGLTCFSCLQLGTKRPSWLVRRYYLRSKVWLEFRRGHKKMALYGNTLAQHLHLHWNHGFVLPPFVLVIRIDSQCEQKHMFLVGWCFPCVN